jgi:uncharacterized protein with FMN-binding domain
VRKSIVVVLTAAALAFPSTEALAGARSTRAAAPRKRISTVAKSFTGAPGSAGRWGEVQITIVVEKKTTTVGKKSTVTRRMVAIRIPVYPNHTDRSIRINQQALPILTQEALHAQSAKIDILSGATYTSQGFTGSLSAALTKARGW